MVAHSAAAKSGCPADLKPVSMTHHTTPLEVPSDLFGLREALGGLTEVSLGQPMFLVEYDVFHIYLYFLRNSTERIDCFVVALRECPSTGGTMLIAIDY